MRLATWTLLLFADLAWSFTMISPTAFKQPTHRGVVSGMTRGNIIRMLELGRGARGRAPQSSAMTAKCNGITCAKEPLLKWRSAVVGFLAATCVLVTEAGPALSVEFSPPPTTPATASTTEGEMVVPTIKLEGELAVQFQKAQSAGSVQQFDKAKKLYNQIIKNAPGYVYGWSNRGNVLIAEGDLKGAISDYNRALELADGLSMPDKWIIYLNRGTSLLALGENDRALADLDQAGKLNKAKDLYILANRAQAYERKGDWRAALRDYEGAVNTQPGNVQPWWIRYSLVLFEEGRDFDSLAFLRRLQSKFEGTGEVQAAVTAVEFARGDFGAAERAWRGINMVDQRMYRTKSYLQDQLKWPPRIIESLEAFDRQQKELDSRQLEAPKPVAS
ncbi:unnamed protein product [Ascophyllum nodosum]